MLKRVIDIFFIASILLSCNCPDVKGKQEIQFYFRRTGNNNGYETHFDEFKIINYSNKTVLAKSLYEFAKHYIDTVHSTQAVSSVTFIGQKAYDELPLDPVEDPFDTESKNSLIGFDFSNILPSNKPKATQLEELVIWKNGEAIVYDIQEPAGRRFIDSVLTSKQPFSSDF